MNIKQEAHENVMVLALSGRLDTLNFQTLDNTIMELLQNDHKNFILDCQEMDYVSSSGLRILLKALKQVKASGGRLLICGLQTEIVKIFKISGFNNLFETFPGKTEALSAF